jgi:hypothetical protein
VETQCPGRGFVAIVESDGPFVVTWDGPIDFVYIGTFACTSDAPIDELRWTLNGTMLAMDKRGHRPHFKASRSSSIRAIAGAVTRRPGNPQTQATIPKSVAEP